MRYSFSGHESFHCKSLWLKKGYDFICNKKHFADTDSVVELGVGKNMVSAIRYWLKAFSLTKEDTLTDLAEYIFRYGIYNRLLLNILYVINQKYGLNL